MRKSDTKASKESFGQSSRNISVKETATNTDAAFPAVESLLIGRNFRLGIMHRLLTVGLHSSLMNAMSTASAQVVMPSIQDISSAIAVTLCPATGEPESLLLRVTIMPLVIEVKQPKNGRRKSTKKK